MTVSQSPVLDFPAMLHGHVSAVRRRVAAKGKVWAREYLMTGGFTQPRRTLQVPPGEPMVMHSASEFYFMDREGWRIYMFAEVYRCLDEGIPRESRQHMRETFETFCQSTSWGTLYHAISPHPPLSAERMAIRLAALLRFWEVLQGPRYAYGGTRGAHLTLDDLVEHIYGLTMEAWCPEDVGAANERLSRMVERRARATRQDCLETVLRMMPLVVRLDKHLKHREVLSDPGFLRERLTALPPKDFDSLSSADVYSVDGQLCAWDRELGRR